MPSAAFAAVLPSCRDSVLYLEPHSPSEYWRGDLGIGVVWGPQGKEGFLNDSIFLKLEGFVFGEGVIVPRK